MTAYLSTTHLFQFAKINSNLPLSTRKKSNCKSNYYLFKITEVSSLTKLWRTLTA